MRFEFATATRIVFGPGTIQDVGPRAAEMGRRAFVVTGRSRERATPLVEQLQGQGVKCTTFTVFEEPTTTMASERVQQARQAGCDLVVGIGGGSVIDTGKVVAALLTNKGHLMDYLEVIGGGQHLTNTPVPYIAIPTTAGAGAEVTRNAVLRSPEQHVKVSIRSASMLPRLAVVDPELTHSMPPAITASTGLDAITQLMEAYASNQSNPLTDGICREGLRQAARSLHRAYEDGSNRDAREGMSVASLFGGLALANAKLGAVHGFAGPLGGMFSAPHGVICARLLPYVMEANVRALRSRAPGSPALVRYDEVAQILTGTAAAGAADGIAWVQELCGALRVASLGEFGLKEADLPAVVEMSKRASSMKGNPITLTDRELTEILRKAI